MSVFEESECLSSKNQNACPRGIGMFVPGLSGRSRKGRNRMIIIQNGTVIDPASGLQGRMAVVIGEDGRIKDLIPAGVRLPEAPEGEGREVWDADGCIVAPGLVDTHSHFRDPGFTYKEDLHTGALAAAAGGYTTVILMANTNPPVDSVEVLTDILTRGSREAIHIYSAANVTGGMQGLEVNDLSALKEAGAVVFTDDGKPILEETIFREALQRADKLGIPVSLHEEDPSYIAENGIHGGGEAAKSLGIGGSDRMAEISMVKRDTQIAAKLGAKLLIQHISTAEGVELVRRARRDNPLIAAEATPHHFSLTEQAVLEKGSQAKVNPPLRTEKDRMAIIRGMQDGTISIIATDHAPHSSKEKAAKPLWKAPSGMIGLETALSLALKHLVEPGYLTMSDMLAMLTCHPADYYGLPAGRLERGACADLVIFDPKARRTVTEEGFHSRSCNSPFVGETLPGVVRCTVAAGRMIYGELRKQ